MPTIRYKRICLQIKHAFQNVHIIDLIPSEIMNGDMIKILAYIDKNWTRVGLKWASVLNINVT